MKFQPGVSGNPQGRRPGTGHRQQLFNIYVMPHHEALFETAVKLALGGNEPMLRLLLERMLPARPVDDAVTMMVSETSGRIEDITVWGNTILKDLSQGTITPKEGNTLMACVEAQRKNIETLELSQRISEIERTLKQRRKIDAAKKRKPK